MPPSLAIPSVIRLKILLRSRSTRSSSSQRFSVCSPSNSPSHGEFDGEQTEKRCELDDRVERDRRSIFKRITDGIANDGGIVERRALLLHFNFNDFLGVVPGSAGVGHEDGLIEAEDGDGEKIADEEEGFDEGESKRGEEHGNEDVEHALLRVFGANLDDLFAIGDAGGSSSVQLDIGFNEFDRAVSAGSYGLRARAGEPVNHGTAGDQAKNERRVQERKIVDVFG